MKRVDTSGLTNSNPKFTKVKPTVEIWDSVGLGLIISYPTGVLISTQTGGTACLHPEIEGIYLPLANDYYTDTKEFFSPEIELSEYFVSQYHRSGAVNGISLKDVQVIETILNKYNLSSFIEVDRKKLLQSHESWIWVKLQQTNNMLLSNFTFPLSAILTWNNSD